MRSTQYVSQSNLITGIQWTHHNGGLKCRQFKAITDDVIHRSILLNALSFTLDRTSPVCSSACSSPALISPIKPVRQIVHHTRPLPLLSCYLLLLLADLLLKSSITAHFLPVILPPKMNANSAKNSPPFMLLFRLLCS